MTTEKANVADLLGDQGPFADTRPGFKARTGQQELAQAIDECIDKRDILIGEAGTGIGKTYAYLAAVLISGKRVIISTGTRHLQDQLFHTDLPAARRALHSDARVALLKGRANYVCLSRLQKAGRNPALREPQLAAQLQAIRIWATQTRSGDIAEVLEVPESSPVWQHVTSSDDHCSDHEPGDLPGCYVLQARKRAMEASIVVVNHHLFCADLALKEGSFGELLPDAEVVVVDEAHQLPDTAAVFFGRRLSSRQLFDLARDSIAEFLAEAPEIGEIRDRATLLDKTVRDFRLALGLPQRRAAWAEVANELPVQTALADLREALELLFEPLDLAAVRGKGLEACRRRCMEQLENLEAFSDARDEHYVHWFETFRTGFSLNLTPQNVAVPFARAVEQLQAAWVYTSATLSVADSFTHFKSQLGIEDARELLVDSPFDYRRNALLYLPANMPAPSQPGYDEAVLTVVEQIVQAGQGRCFALFTSHRALQQAAAQLRRTCRYPVLIQGQMPKRELIDAFQSMGNAVLLGTSSFWEGVDVRGDALSSVVIDRLPFASPGDPVLQARIRQLQGNGVNAFREYQLPKAVLMLKQGVGRLIRDVSDRGVLALCDPRLQTMDYGQIFLDSLPDMRIVQRIESVQRFFAAPAVNEPT